MFSLQRNGYQGLLLAYVIIFLLLRVRLLTLVQIVAIVTTITLIYPRLVIEVGKDVLMRRMFFSSITQGRFDESDFLRNFMDSLWPKL
jgi:hypothetical protein